MNSNVRRTSRMMLTVILLGASLAACAPQSEAPATGGQAPSPQGPSAVIPEPGQGQPAAQADFNTWIYGGPGENYAVYAAFVGGQRALVTGRNAAGDWWAISVPPAANGVGWVSEASVTVQGAEGVAVLPAPPVPPTTGLVPPGPGDPQATALVNTYVRTGPGAEYPAYGIAVAGSVGHLLGRSADSQWLVVRLDPVKVGAGHGWVASNTVQAANSDNLPLLQAAAPPQVSAPNPPPGDGPSATALDYINVRSGPGPTYPVYFVAAPGASGIVNGRSADSAWWRVGIPTNYAPDGFGWVSADYVTTQNVEGVPVIEAPPPPDFPATPPATAECVLVSQDPPDYATIAPGTIFQMSWTLKNTGAGSWDKGAFDIRYLGSTSVRLHEGSDLYDLQSTVDPQGTYEVSGRMIAPTEPGTYAEAWAIASGGQAVCPFWVTIVVK